MGRYSITYEYVEQTQACLKEAVSFFKKVVQSETVITLADEARAKRTAQIQKLLFEANDKLKTAASLLLAENAGHETVSETKEIT